MRCRLTTVALFWPLFSVAVALGAASCGYIGDTMPPARRIPTNVADLTAVQRGNKIFLQFTLPKATTEGDLIAKFEAVQVEIGPDVTPFSTDAWFAKMKPVEIDVSGEDQTSAISHQIEAGPYVDQQIAIAIRTSARRNRWSPFSNFVHLQIVPPLDPPKIEVTATGKGYLVSWTPQRDHLKWRIYRRAPATQTAPVLLGTADAPPYLDQTAQFETDYEYSVVAIEETPVSIAESEASPAFHINEKDTFPPAVPASITVLAGSSSLEVTWERSPDADLKGYYVYRSVDSGPFQRVGNLQTTPAYSDHDIKPGVHYRYAVSAADLKNNQSERSSVAEITAP
ncbi:MAG: hypothetical protein WBW33_05725 [Bryobacteraceae bacterium]